MALERDDVGFYDNRGRFVVENGRIHVYVGNTSSQSDNTATFTVIGGRRVEVSKRRRWNRRHPVTKTPPRL